MPRIRVGISGWRYAPWRANFYPESLPQSRELAYASRRFSALEINGTSYSLQLPSSFEAWRDASPPGFCFALKGGRYITHMRRLRDAATPLANFCASGMLALHDKLGPILWQFPPQMGFDAGRFREFFGLLPRDTIEMAKLALRHDDWMHDRVHLEPDARRTIRHAVEFRHESFRTRGFVDLLREFNIALVIADVAGRFPTAQDVTADFLYLRLHGSRTMYQSGYTPRELDTWADRIRAWHAGGEPAGADRIGGRAPGARRGRDVFVFFDNTDVKLRAPVDAQALAKRLGMAPNETPRQTLAEVLTLPLRAAGEPA